MSLPAGLLVPREVRQRYRTRRLLHPGRAARPRSRAKSGRPSARLAREVLAKDRHRCVACGFAPRPVMRRGRKVWPGLQIDHIEPWIFGGLTWGPNLATLCKACNGTKGIYWESPQGKVYYHATWGRSDVVLAAAIHRAEVRAHHSVRRALTPAA